MEKVLLVERVAAGRRSVCPPDCSASRSWTAPRSKPFWRAPSDFQPLQSQTVKKLDTAARQDDRQPLLRGLHAHAHQLRNRRQAPGRRRRLHHRFRLQRLQRRIAGRYAEHAGRHAAQRHRDAPRRLGRAAFSGAPPADAHHQRRRRHARTSHAGAARRPHHPRPPRNRSKACASPSSATSPTAASRARTCICFRSSARTSCSAAPLRCCPPNSRNSRPASRLTNDIREAIRDADVIMMLRVQLERQHEARISRERIFPVLWPAPGALDLAKPDAIVMHPGPINRGRELSSEVADSSAPSS